VLILYLQWIKLQRNHTAGLTQNTVEQLNCIHDHGIEIHKCYVLLKLCGFHVAYTSVKADNSINALWEVFYICSLADIHSTVARSFCCADGETFQVMSFSERSGDALNLYSGGGQFDSHLGHGLFLLEAFVIFLLGEYLDSIHPSPVHSALNSLRHWHDRQIPETECDIRLRF
jgi:hypothetical protein